MKHISISDIRISDNRQRRVFDQGGLLELKESIEKLGLQNAVVLRRQGSDHFLVSGERRLRAIRDLYDLGGAFRHDGANVPAGHVPYTLLEELDPLAAEEAELDENIKRKDLTFQERAAAVLRLKNLREQQAIVAGKPAPTTADLTQELTGHRSGRQYDTTKKELIVAAHLDDPDVKKAATLDDAFKVLQRKEQVRQDAKHAEAVGKIYTSAVHTLLNEDSLRWMLSSPAEQYDVILTDPPYGMGADEFGDADGRAVGAHDYEDSPANFQKILNVLVPSSMRITKPQAHLYWFCDIDWFSRLREMLDGAGWQVFRTPLIWYKRHGSRAPWPQHGPQRKYETIVYAVKGKRPVLRMAGDVLDYPADENLGHHAQKPVALFEDLLSRSCRAGDYVLDPFCGSGPIFAAAHKMKLKATGVEQSASAYGVALKRLESLKEAA